MSRIAFIGTSLAPRVSGVGDYMLSLSGMLANLGHSALMIGFRDGTDEETESVLRLPAGLPESQRAKRVTEALNRFQPDWLSLQFVPYAWHPRGFCFGLAQTLAPWIGRRKVHVMMHELWVGLSRNDRLVNHLQGMIQRLAILRLLRQLRPVCLHTSNPSYAAVLRGVGYAAEVLPLFGNVPVTDDGRRRLRERLSASGVLAAGESWDGLLIAGWFGTVHREWDGYETVERLRMAARNGRRKLVLVSIGRQGAHGDALTDTLDARGEDEVVVLRVGEVDGAEAGAWVSSLDVALTPNPLALIGKSGTATAFLEAGVPVLVTRNDWLPRRWKAVPPADDPLIVYSPRGTVVDWSVLRRLRRTPASRLRKVTAQFVHDLNAGERQWAER